MIIKNAVGTDIFCANILQVTTVRCGFSLNVFGNKTLHKGILAVGNPSLNDTITQIEMSYCRGVP
jgi:hypothetical protein